MEVISPEELGLEYYSAKMNDRAIEHKLILKVTYETKVNVDK